MSGFLASRATDIDASGIRRIFDLGATMKNPVNLGIGQPHFDVPGPIKAEMQRLTEAGFNAYTPTQGVPDLIQAVKADITRNKGREPEDLFITSGVSGGLSLAYSAILNPGDEIIIPDPYFVIYRHMARLVDAKAVCLDTYPDFRIRKDRLEKLVTPKTRAILLNSPNNPTGMIHQKEEIEAAIAVAKAHDLWLISDEIYEIFNYQGGAFAPVPSPWASYEKTLLLSGFSKSFSMTGWRLGYAAGPERLLREMKKLQQYTFVCAPHVAQRAALKGFEEPVKAELREHVAAYTRKRNRVYEVLSPAFGKGAVQMSEGAFYAFIEAPGGDGAAFVEKAIAKEVLIIPGEVFSTRKTHFRLSFAVPDPVLDRGLDILASLAKGAP